MSSILPSDLLPLPPVRTFQPPLQVLCVSRYTAHSRICRVANPITRGTFRDTREQAEKLFAHLVGHGAAVELEKEDIGTETNGFNSIRQFVRIDACGHSFLFVLVHCIVRNGDGSTYGDLCFYAVK